jgi:hypothetical protein
MSLPRYPLFFPSSLRTFLSLTRPSLAFLFTSLPPFPPPFHPSFLNGRTDRYARPSDPIPSLPPHLILSHHIITASFIPFQYRQRSMLAFESEDDRQDI